MPDGGGPACGCVSDAVPKKWADVDERANPAGAPEFQDIAAIRFMLRCSICTHIGQWVRRKIYLMIRKLMFLIC
nr:hypothetical protein [Sphingomonas sp.]